MDTSTPVIAKLPKRLERVLTQLASDPCGGVIGTVLINSFAPFGGVLSSLMPVVNGMLGISRGGGGQCFSVAKDQVTKGGLGACDTGSEDIISSVEPAINNMTYLIDDGSWRSVLLALEEREIWQQAGEYFETKLKERR